MAVSAAFTSAVRSAGRSARLGFGCAVIGSPVAGACGREGRSDLRRRPAGSGAGRSPGAAEARGSGGPEIHGAEQAEVDRVDHGAAVEIDVGVVAGLALRLQVGSLEDAKIDGVHHLVAV